jgi:RNA polymerase sigma factor (sigma-70 family)
VSSAAASLPRGPSHHVLLSALPDERLAKIAAQGSTAAFTAIYKRHHQDLYRYCQSLTGNEQDARDALQETMIKAMRALSGEPREIALRPWLFRIAHNESVTVMRRRRPTASLESIGELPSSGGVDDVARERVRELFEDFAHLTPRQRSALVMRELNGLGFEEIGVALQISPAAAKQTVYEARQALLEVAKGRDTDCLEVRERISARDRRMLRGRGISAHLRSCSDCREFEAGIATRGEKLAAVAPLPAAMSTGILQEVLGVAGGGAGGGGIAIAAAGGSLTAVAKLGVAGVVALGVGTLAIESRSSDSAGGSAAGGSGGPPALERVADSNGQAAVKGAIGGESQRAHGASRADSVPRSSGGASGDHAGGSANAGGGRGTGTATHGPGGGQGASPSSPSGPSASAAQSEPSGAGGSSGGSAGPAEAPAPAHGGTPPGQGGSPPGLDGELPPGLGGTPPGLDGEVPPGQGGTPPGLDGEVPPGQNGTSAGQSGVLPPGQAGTPPGQGN